LEAVSHWRKCTKECELLPFWVLLVTKNVRKKIFSMKYGLRNWVQIGHVCKKTVFPKMVRSTSHSSGGRSATVRTAICNPLRNIRRQCAWCHRASKSTTNFSVRHLLFTAFSLSLSPLNGGTLYRVCLFALRVRRRISRRKKSFCDMDPALSPRKDGKVCENGELVSGSAPHDKVAAANGPCRLCLGRKGVHDAGEVYPIGARSRWIFPLARAGLTRFGLD
jgi:hypothetical protein